ncbi:putative DJ-1/PfpI family protein [Fusarium oxysporum f. sp. albedinis]|nr:putative DJ-1/PfpI family protein [Fusarium oxysporum f. sp. albedinis]
MGRRALTAEEKAERQRQRQEALHVKHTLELVREHALGPHLRVIVDRATAHRALKTKNTYISPIDVLISQSPYVSRLVLLCLFILLLLDPRIG